tara:strand:+ start:2825 stop:6550 length:3726 start_codon:yes stop_codon:yes gene_type:complete
MEHPASGVFLVKFIFEISDVHCICTHAEGNIDLLIGCSPEDFTSQKLKLTDLFHPADEDIASELFSNTSLYVDKAFTFRLISPIESKVIIVKSVSNKLVDSTGGFKLELSLFFSASSEPSDWVNKALLMNYVSLLDNTNDFIYFKNKYHVFTGASQSLVQITNAQSHWSELIGKSDYEVFSKSYADVYFSLEKQLFNGEVEVAQEIQPYIDKIGQSGWVDNRKYPIKNELGEVIGLFGVARDITRLIETENALKKSEQEFRNIYENAPVGLFQTTYEGKLLGCNPAFALMLGFTNPEQAIVNLTNISEQVYVHHADRDSLVKKIVAQESWVALDMVEWRCQDNNVICVELYGRKLFNPDTNITILEGAALDITRRINAEKKLKRSNYLYAALSKCNEAIIRCKTEQELFDTVCKDAVDHAEFKMAWIAKLESDNETVNPITVYGNGKEYLEHTYINTKLGSPLSQGPTGRAFLEENAIWCQDFQNDQMTIPWREQGLRFGWKSSASIPLFRGGKVVAALNLYADHLNAFDVPEQTLLLEMGKDISYALDHFEELRLIQKYDRELRESQALNRVANRLAKIGGWAVELPDMRLIWSDEIYAIHGLAPDEGITVERALSFYPGKYNKLVRNSVATCLSDGSPYELDAQIINAKGQRKWTRTSGQGVWSSDGELIGIHGAMQDITSIKENEASLKKLSQAVEQSPSSVLITDVAARIEYVNETFLNQTGYTIEEVIGQNPRLLQSGKTLSNDYREMWSALKQGKAWRGEFYNKRKDGSEYVVSLMISPVRNDDGEIINYLAIEDDITEKKQDEERINYLAHHDQLTGLPNRVLLNDHFQFALNSAERNHEQLAVMFLDLDNFKTINDALGHSIGDKLLIELSQRLKSILRNDDLIGRFGGDEFIIVLPKTEGNGAGVLAQKLIEIIGEPFYIGPYKLTCSSSIGIAIFPEDGAEVDILSKNADAAMYKVKQLSKNNFMFFTPQMQEKSKRNLELSLALRTAIQEEVLYLMYQPQVRLMDMKMIGIEALVRWNHPEFGEVSPAEFIPIAEESGLINDIGRWVLERAIADMQQLLSKTSDEFQIAINISVVQFRNRNLINDIGNLLRLYAVPASRVTLELTEAVAMSEPEIAIAIMDELHKIGVGIAIDDFGTGYSSLSYLKKFRVNKLKIDKSFVDDIETDSDDRAIASAIISMAKSLGLTTIAEGVETKAQVDWLNENHCDQIQGYFFSKPLLFNKLLTNKLLS